MMNDTGIRQVNKYVLEQMKKGVISEEDTYDLLTALNYKSRRQKDEIAIIGMQCRFSCANDKDEYWNNIINGVDCVKGFNTDRARDVLADGNNIEWQKYRAGYLDDISLFDHSFFRISLREAELMDPYQKIFMEAGFQCIEDAGYGNGKISNTRTGVFAGIDTTNKSQYMNMTSEGGTLSLVGSLNSILTSRIPYIMNLYGPAMVIDTACSSGLVAVHQACSAINNGECEMALAAGINLIIIPDYTGMTSGLTSKDLRTRAFDNTGSGFAWGEGIGVILLKKLKHAIRDRDNIYAVIKGSAVNNDGSSNGITAPNPMAQTDVILRAWENANIDPERISYIEAHGTGTELGDPIEAKGISDAFLCHTDKKQFCALGSVKTNIGHTVAASGLASIFKIVMGMMNDYYPPTLNFSYPNTKIDFMGSPIYINTRKKRWIRGDDKRLAGINAFGISGTNCHLVIQEAPENDSKNTVENREYIFTLSARTVEVLSDYVDRYVSFLDHITKKGSVPALRDICYTACTGRGHYYYRLAAIVESAHQLLEVLSDIRIKYIPDGFYDGTSCSGQLRSGVYCSLPGEKKEPQENSRLKHEKIELDEAASTIINQKNMTGYLGEIQLKRLCELYVRGAEVNWEFVYSGLNARKTTLPPYPFERKKCWVDVSRMNKNAVGKPDSPYFKTQWILSDFETGQAGISHECILLFTNDPDKEFERELKKQNKRVITVFHGSEYKQIDDDRYFIDDNEESYRDLFVQISDTGFSQIIMAAAYKVSNEVCGLPDIEMTISGGLYSLYNIVKGMARAEIHNIVDVVILSDYAYGVTGNQELIKPENAILSGSGQAVTLENPNIRCRCIDTDNETPIETVIREINTAAADYKTAYRKNRRYIEELVPYNMLETNKTGSDVIRDKGVYLITGGRGSIGLEIAKYIAGLKEVVLVLVNRSIMPERREWDSIVEMDGESAAAYQIKQIMYIEQIGSKVECIDGDISDETFAITLFNRLDETYGKVNGIIHCAGIPSEKVIINKPMKSVETVIRPKVHGTWLLDSLTRKFNMDFMILFSSISSILTREGQADYISANSYLDSYAEYRNSIGLRTQTINWTVWKDTGMGREISRKMDNSLLKPITIKEGIDCFEEIIKNEIVRICVCPINRSGIFNFRRDQFSVRIPQDILAMHNPDDLSAANKLRRSVSINGKKDGSYTKTETLLANIWGEVLGCDEININDIFFELGGDSLHAIKVANLVNSKMDIKIHPGDVLKHATIMECSRFIDENKLKSFNLDDFELKRVEELLNELED